MNTTTSRRQFPSVNCQYGAPMGRLESRETPVCKVRLFRVRLDSGGYDDGGAYWGIGQPLYCADDGEGYFRFMRARNRAEAAQSLGIEGNLKRACA